MSMCLCVILTTISPFCCVEFAVDMMLNETTVQELRNGNEGYLLLKPLLLGKIPTWLVKTQIAEVSKYLQSNLNINLYREHVL